MKKLLLTGMLGLSILGVSAQDIDPLQFPYYYFVKMSPNGKFVGSMCGGAQLYDVENKAILDYSDCFLGLGNTIADNGMAVGDYADHAMIMNNGYNVTPPSLRNFPFCDLNAITRDATRLCGLANNPEPDGVMFVPIYCDIDADGNIGEVHILPYPKEDFLGNPPVYVTAVWISDDGKSILGQMTDFFGRQCDPIMFYEDEDGEWSSWLPTRKLFNPDNIQMPENPWLNEPPFPEATDYMYPEARANYEIEYEDWLMSGCPQDLWPDPLTFMTIEQEEAYLDAYVKYMEWNDSAQQAIYDYEMAYREVLLSSTYFGLNDLALSPDGNVALCSGGYDTLVNGEYISVPKIYQFTRGEEEIKTIDPRPRSVYPSQILSNGTMIFSLPQMANPNTYIYYPEEDYFMPLIEYFERSQPGYVNWIMDTTGGSTGLVSISDDMQTFAGGLLAGHLLNNNDPDLLYTSYLFMPGLAGVEETVANPEDVTYRVYNLNGINVMTTKDAQQVNTLPAGIYIVNGKKVVIK